jgi:lipoyl synthase
MTSPKHHPPSREDPQGHQRGADKLLPLRQPDEPRDGPPKPPWLRLKIGLGGVQRVKEILRRSQLATVCEEAACPNLGECFNHGTATFMILGELCTRRCPFCDVAHGKPLPPDPQEPERLAAAVRELGLRYVVITSVDRDDLRDGGAGHFAACVRALRGVDPALRIEVLTPDFRGRLEPALDAFADALPDVFNHNLETVPRLYPRVRPGADYATSLELLRRFRARYPGVPTKSGLMLGLGEQRGEIEQTLRELRSHGCDLLTLGQYLQPSKAHLPVERYLPPEEFAELGRFATDAGFLGVASGPLVRSSYQADLQARGVLPMG